MVKQSPNTPTCNNANTYKARHAPKCFGGHCCKACRLKWEASPHNPANMKKPTRGEIAAALSYQRTTFIEPMRMRGPPKKRR